MLNFKKETATFKVAVTGILLEYYAAAGGDREFKMFLFNGYVRGVSKNDVRTGARLVRDPRLLRRF